MNNLQTNPQSPSYFDEQNFRQKHLGNNNRLEGTSTTQITDNRPALRLRVTLVSGAKRTTVIIINRKIKSKFPSLEFYTSVI